MTLMTRCLVLHPHLIDLIRPELGDPYEFGLFHTRLWPLETMVIPLLSLDAVHYNYQFWTDCKSAGIKRILVVSESLAIHPEFEIGEWVRIRDHLNFLSRNPLIEFFQDRKLEFSDVKHVYADCYTRNTRKTEGIKSAVLLGLDHPACITPAEVNWYRKMGADVVDGHLVSVILTAYASGLECLAWSYIAGKTGMPSDQVPDISPIPEKSIRDGLIETVISFI